MRRSARTLNEMPLRECYAFELRIIIENRREDGMHGSPQRRPKSDPLAWRREGEVVALFDPDTLEVTTSVFYSQRDTTQDRGRLLTASERIRAARVMERS